jgi:hypothetical protein
VVRAGGSETAIAALMPRLIMSAALYLTSPSSGYRPSAKGHQELAARTSAWIGLVAAVDPLLRGEPTRAPVIPT